MRARSRRPLGPLAWGFAAAIPVLFVGVFFLWPVIALVATGLTSGGQLDLGGLPEVLGLERSWRVLQNTLVQASLATVVAILLGVPAAYVLYRLEFRGRGVLRALLTVPFVLPAVVVGVAFTALFGPGGALYWLGLDRSLVVVVLALAFFNVTVVARTVGGYWAQLDTRQGQAARTLGAGPVRVFCTVTLPALGPALASAGALVFLFCATSFGVVLILGGREFANIETEVYRLTVQFLDLRSAAVLSLVQFAIVALALIASALLRSRNERAQEVRIEVRAPRRTDAPVLAVFGVTVLLLHVLPIGALVWRSLQGPRGVGISFANYRALFDPPERSPLHGSVVDAALLSFGIACVATLIAVTLGMLVSLIVSRRPRSAALRRGIAVYDAAIMLPLGISAVTLGFGLLLTMHKPLGIGFDLRTSVVLIPIAQALVALPLVVRTLTPVLRSIDPRTREAAMMLGASPLRVLRTIDFALLGRSAGLALGFAFAVSLGEFGATAFLVRPDAQTLPVAIAALVGSPDPASYGMALAASVVLGAIAAGIMVVAERWRVDSGVGGSW
ncbi:ABC transporter permease [Leucobacter sp. NPDC015123]|uniref:ABC transporter permease n=1 Tax=Leucobacter sp. NPDC015123 TaxID=3364129 RepID=UPI0036F47B35